MTPRFRLVPLLLVALGVAVGAQQADSPPQQPPVTFRAEVNFVEVDAIVTDEDGTFVPDLTSSDFEIFENGEPQEVASFGIVDIPIEPTERPLFADAPIEPDVTTNARAYDGRLYLLLLDDLHTAPLRTAIVKRAATRFIENDVGANDQVAIVYTSGRSDASQEFTSSRHRLLASIDKFIGQKLRATALERLDRYRTLQQTQTDQQRADNGVIVDSQVQDPQDMQRGAQAESMLRTLRNAAELLTNVRGRRKSLVLFSEGIDYNVYDYRNSRYSSFVMDDVRDVLAAATQGNVSIYTVDPRGLTAGLEDAIDMQAPTALPTVIDISPNTFADEVRLSQDSLRVFSEETGGLAFVGSNDLDRAFREIVRDNSAYYILGYYASNDRRDGKFRNIDVRVKRPGLTVRARKGYMAPTGKPKAPARLEVENTSPELQEALNNPLQVSGLAMAATTAAFKGERPKASVAVTVQLSGSSLEFTESDGRYADTVEVSVVALDEDGKVRGGDRHEIAMELKPATYELVRTGGMRLQSRLTLEPGRYHLRVAGRETGAGRVGSVFADLDVPDFSDSTLVMSDIIMTSIEATAGTPTAKPDEQLGPLLPGPPTTDRVFSADDRLSLFVDVYDNETKRPHKVDIKTSVLSSQGAELFAASEERDSVELGGAAGGYGHQATIPLESLSPGLYVLRVEARSRLKSDEPVMKEVPFRVRPAGTPREFGG